MHAVSGAYAKPIFVDKLGASLVWSSTPLLNYYKQTEKKLFLYIISYEKKYIIEKEG